VTNGPDIFQMLLVLNCHLFTRTELVASLVLIIYDKNKYSHWQDTNKYSVLGAYTITDPVNGLQGVH